MNITTRLDTNNERLAKIAAAIAMGVRSVSGDIDAQKEARKVYDTATTNALGTRSVVMLSLVNTAQAEAWTGAEIAQGLALAARNDNRKEKTTKTYMGELALVLSDNVRPVAEALRTMVAEAWDAEKAVKDGPRPIAKAFVREYHAFIAAARAVKDGTMVFRGASDVAQFAREHDPDLDYRKVAGRLENIRKTLADFARDFPCAGFAEIDAFFGDINEGQLKAARDEKLAAEAKALEDITLPAQEVLAPAASAATAQEVTPAPGVFDLALNELSELAA
jgi:hypothetical protein